MGDYQSLVDEVVKELEQPNRFSTFGVLRNPFPKAGETAAEPFHNQAEANTAFLEYKFKPFIKSEGTESNRLLVYGDHRVGKTNFLMHWHGLISRLLEDRIVVGYSCVYRSLYSGTFLDDVHKPLVTELSKSVFPSFFEGFEPTGLANKDDDLARAISKTVPRQAKMFTNDRDPRLNLFAKWFSADKCSSAELKELGVSSSIDTASLAIRYLRDFIELAQERKLMKGIVVFLDEFELIFSRSVTPSNRARYLQDLRHFIDTLQKGILMLVASLPAVQIDFQRDYPAVRNRFGDNQDLKEIRSAVEAKAYANAYLDYARKSYKAPHKKQGKPKDLISSAEIERIYQQVLEEQKKVTQGWFFAKLHDTVEEQVREGKS
jgi:hypothetical protein